jgi:dolichyl-phosphate beta-glucosyltransferase
MQTLAIIIPCYNEAARLNIDLMGKLIEGISDATIYFVNDGSLDHTLQVLNTLAGKYPGKVVILSFPKNEGKAKAIAKGFEHLIHSESFSYIGYMDADFSTPVQEFISLYNMLVEKKASYIFGSRIKKLNSGIKRKPFRHLIGRSIATIVDFRFNLGVYDTQCGAKIFLSKVAVAAFDKPFYCNWLFDVEIFLRLKQHNLLNSGIEMPLTGWKDIGGSKLSFTTFPKICKELLLLTRKY